MALVHLERAHLGLAGIAGDRTFAVIDEADRLVNGKRVGTLALIRPEFDVAARRLTLRFPEGSVAAGQVDLGEPLEAWFFGKPRAALLALGPWAEALSGWARRPLRLVVVGHAGDGLDRGPSATLLSVAALASLARAGGVDQPLDRRRFRMTFGIDGVPAHAEDGWFDRDVRIGGALVRPAGNVGRCAVTTHDPDTGVASFDTLQVLQATRGSLASTEPLPFGVWADVIAPGDVSLGDPVEPL
jgi:uncharacterized protein YcbX